MFRTFLSRGLILLVVCLLGIGILQTSGQSGSITGTVSLLPTTWDTQWLNQTTGTIRCYVGNLSGGRTVSQIIPSSIRLNNTVPLYNNTSRIRPSQTGFTGAVLEGAFFRPAALASMGWVVPGRSYPVVISGQFQDQVPFTCTAQILIGGPALVDNAAPVVTITGVSNNQCTASSITPVITVTDKYLNVVTITLDGQTFVSGTTVTATGSHLLHVAASDQVGNNTVRDVSFTIDQSDPVIAISGVTEGECRSSSVTPTIAITDACLGVTTITLNSQPYVSGISIASDGNYQLHAEASDLSGHSASQDINFIIDQTAPVAGSNVSNGQVSATPLQIYAQCTDANPAASVLTIDGQVVADGATLSVDGTYLIVVTCTDCAGNTGQYQATVTIQSQTSTDTEIPGIFITAPENNSKTNNPQPTITIKYKDQESGINQSSLIVTLNSESIVGQFSLNADGGSYQPSQALANGTYTLNVSIQDNAGNSNSASCSFEIDVARPTETPLTGYIQGIVYDTDSEHPLADVIVTGRDAQMNVLPGRVLTDALGRFSYPTPGAGTYFVDFNKSGFAYNQRQANVETDKPVAVDPIYMKPLDPAVTTITPSGGSHTDSRQLVEIDFPSGAVDHPINVSVTPIDTFLQLPTNLPDSSVFTYCFELEPHGQVFNVPLTIRVKNTLGFDVGDSIPVGFFSPEIGQWQHLTMAYVQPGGEWIEYQANRFSWHDVNAAPPPTPQGPRDLEPDATGDQDFDEEAGGCGSKYAYQSGNLSIYLDLPAIRVMGEWEQLSLTYNSLSTKPSILAAYVVDLTSSQTAAARTSFSVRGVGDYGEGFSYGASYSWQNGPARYAAELGLTSVYGSILPTGSYLTITEIRNEFDSQVYWSSRCFGCGPISRTRAYTRQSVAAPLVIIRRVAVINARESIFGAGWGLNGLKQVLGKPEDEFVLLWDGSGSLRHFYKQPSGIFTNEHHKDEKIEYNQSSHSFVLKEIDGSMTQFNANGYMSRMELPNNIVYSCAWDGQRLSSITDPLNRVINFEYDNSGHIKKITDQAGRSTNFKVDSMNRLESVRFPDGTRRQYEYKDGDFLLVAKIDENGARTDYEYDGNRLRRIRGASCCGGKTVEIRPSATVGLVGQIPPGVGTTTNPAELPTEQEVADLEIDGLGNVTTMTHNSAGLPTKIKDPLGSETRFAYDKSTYLKSITQPDGGVAIFEYDAFGQVTKLTDPTGAIVQHEYSYENDYGMPMLVAITDANGNRSTADFDSKGNMTRSITATEDTTSYTYNSIGQVTSVTNALGNTAHFEYDANFNLSAVISPLGERIELTYDAVGNVITTTDALGHTTRFTYDSMNQLLTTTDRLGGVTAYNYDPIGNLLSLTDANGHTSHFEYDVEDRLKRQTNPLGYHVDYQYDAAGNLIRQMTADNEEILLQYDANNRLIRKQLPTEVLRYGYDQVGRLTLASRGSHVTRFGYNQRGELLHSTVDGKRIFYSYDRAGNNVRTSLGNWNEDLNSARFYYSGDASVQPGTMCSGDFNRDGYPDLATSSADPAAVSIAINQGNGTFFPAIRYSTGGLLAGRLLSADFDNDGATDIVVANEGSTNVAFLKNTGFGVFAAPLLVETGGSTPHALAIGDFDSDSDPDVAVGHLKSTTFSIIKNDGSFQFSRSNPVNSTFCQSLVAADLDQDGDLDIISLSATLPQAMVAYNRGGTTLLFDNETIGLDAVLADAAVADLNGDDYPDLAFVKANTPASELSEPVRLYLNNGSGHYTTSTSIPDASDGRAIVAADFDQDGDFDLAVAHRNVSSLTILSNGGVADFEPPKFFSSGGSPTGVIVADFDRNDVSDIAVTNDRLQLTVPNPGTGGTTVVDLGGGGSIITNPGSSSFAGSKVVSASTTVPSWGGGVQAVALADVDGDGDKDLIAGRGVAPDRHPNHHGQLTVVSNLGGGAFGAPVDIPGNEFDACDIATGDFDNDLDIDLVCAGGNGPAASNTLELFLNSGGGTFNRQLMPLQGSLPGPVRVETADVNGDSVLDIVTSDIAFNVYVFIGQGNGAFIQRVVQTGQFFPVQTVTSDLDGDGDLDLITSHTGFNELRVRLNDGAGNFPVNSATYVTLDSPAQLFAVDLDNDRDEDVIVQYQFRDGAASGAKPYISILKNDGLGNFLPREDMTLGEQISDLSIADVDADGDPDLVYTDIGQGIAVAFNSGNGQFQVGPYFAAGELNIRLVTDDLNGDGVIEAYVCDGANQNVSRVTLNLGGTAEGLVTEREYDENQRVVKQVTKLLLETTDSLACNWSYSAVGELDSTWQSSGLKEEFTYDFDSRLVKREDYINNALFSTVSYDYDSNSNRTNMIDKWGNHHYTYDYLDRILSVDHPGPPLEDEQYTWDPVENRITSHSSGLYVHDEGNRLLEDAQYSYLYSNGGNLVSRRNLNSQALESFTYDAEHHLTGFSRSISGSVTDSATYAYDGLGRRVRKSVNGSTISYLYDMSNLLTIVENLESPVYLVRGLMTDDLLGVIDDSGVTTAIMDVQKSLISLVGDSGVISHNFRYDSYGVRREVTGAGAVPLGYIGRDYDSESGLLYLRFRYYDPTTGRFITEDPVGLAAGLNLYQYSTNPSKYSDPFGLDASVCTNGNQVDIQIPIQFSGAGYIPIMGTLQQMMIEQTWTGTFGKYEVTTDVIPGNGNQIEVHASNPDNAPETVTMIPGKPDKGDWYATTNPVTAAHEAAHMLGLDDKYKDNGKKGKARKTWPKPGYGGNIQGEWGGKVEQKNINEVIKKNKCTHKPKWDPKK